MARPKNADSEATRARILECALDELSRVAPDQFSTRAVARRAGVSPGVVQLYFGSREGLIDACVDTMYAGVRTLAERLAQEIGKGQGPRCVVRTAVRESYRYARMNQPLMRSLMIRVVRDGVLDDPRRSETELPFLRAATSYFASQLGVAQEEVWLRVQSVIFLVARYAISTDPQHNASARAGEEDTRAERHLIEVAERLLT